MRSVDDSTGRRLAWAFLAFLALLRVLFAWHLPFDSDEAQHLHVVWAWTQGLLPYRDVFDNHAPLFQLLSAPLFAAIGEDADIVRLMRLAVVPWYGLALWCTWRIGRAFYGRRAGAWALALVALYPDFFVASVQYRTDDAWGPVWLAMVMVAVEGRPTPRRAFGVGLLAGAAVAISLKSLVLILAVVVAALLTLGLMRIARRPLPWGTLTRTSGALLAGFVVLPGLFALGFALAGAWDAMIYCTLTHNVVPGDARWALAGRSPWLFPLAVPALAGVAFLLMRDPVRPERGAKRAFVFLAAMLYLALLLAYWPLTPRQDWLPFAPFAAIFLAAGVRRLALRHGSQVRAMAVLGVLLAVELGVLVAERRPWVDGTADARAGLAQVLRLTDADDDVMDAKGDSIYRRRPFYYVLESVTLARMRLGWIPDTIVERLVATRTAVAQTSKLSGETLAFVQRHYLPVSAHWRVVGARLPPATAGQAVEFALGVAARYAVEPHNGSGGVLDGVRYDGPRDLAAGRHVFVPDAPMQRGVVLWAQAVERGFGAMDEAVIADGSTRVARP